MKSPRNQVWVLANCLWVSASLVGAFSTPAPEILPREFIEITNPINIGAENRLPARFVTNWPTWVLGDDGSISKIPDDDGFVQATSIDELWQPVDLKRPDVRLAIGIHVRGGVIRHVMPAVDLSFGDGLHRNRGMCSVPRAHGWIDFTNSIDEWDNYQIVLAKKKNGEEKWTNMSTSSSGVISNAIERALFGLAESPPDEMGQGSHFLNVLLELKDEEKKLVECPKTGFEMRVTMDDAVLPDDTDAAPGILQVAISASVAGSESPYLPDVYTSLYNDESLRNPLYAKFKQRQEERNVKK